MKNTALAILIAAAASIAILSPASAKTRDVVQTPVYSTISVPLFLGIGY